MSISTGQEGERRQITVFFSDLSGYTALTERLDPEDVRAVMDRVFAEATSVTDDLSALVSWLPASCMAPPGRSANSRFG